MENGGLTIDSSIFDAHENALEMFQKAADMDPDNFTFDASRAEE